MLSIGEFSKISEVTPNTLRYYDEIGLIRPAQVSSENGYRYYDVNQLEEMLLINKLKAYSFSLDEIRDILKKDDNEMLLYLMRKKYKMIEEKMTNFQDSLKKLKKDINNLERGVNIMSYLNDIEVRIVETKAQNIISIREIINSDDYAKLIGKLYEKIGREKFTPIGPPMSIYHCAEFDPEKFDAEVAIPVSEKNKETKELPASLCAMVSFKGPYSELTSAHTKINKWIEENNYEIIAPAVEVYISDPMKTAPEDYVTEVYYPVKKK